MRNNGQYMEKLKNDWSTYNEYRCHPKQYLSLLKSNYALNQTINSIFQDRTGFTVAE